MNIICLQIPVMSLQFQRIVCFSGTIQDQRPYHRLSDQFVYRYHTESNERDLPQGGM